MYILPNYQPILRRQCYLGVFTDASCFMDWIASQYKMRMPSGFVKDEAACLPKSTRTFYVPQFLPGIGDFTDLNKTDCQGSFEYDRYETLKEYKYCSAFEKLKPEVTNEDNKTLNCDEIDFAASCRSGSIIGCYKTRFSWSSQKYDSCAFDQIIEGEDLTLELRNSRILDENNRTWSECRLEGAEGFSYNIYQCLDKKGNVGRCANNCRGVSPNSIIIGGFAPIAAAGLAGQAFLVPGLGLAGLGAAGIGAAMGAGGGRGGECPNRRPCKVRGKY